jgi:hypothetical protein
MVLPSAVPKRDNTAPILFHSDYRNPVGLKDRASPSVLLRFWAETSSGGFLLRLFRQICRRQDLSGTDIACNGTNKHLPFVQFHDCSSGLIPIGLGSQRLPRNCFRQEEGSIGVGTQSHEVEKTPVAHFVGIDPHRNARPAFL